MIVLTGGAGFIGSNILSALNKRGESHILVVDHLNAETKKQNLLQKIFYRYIDKADFLKELPGLHEVTAILHQGACSSTTETDEVYLHENNVLYSQTLLAYAIEKKIPFIYASSASVYGNGKLGFSDSGNDYFPINGYARSKLEFDRHVSRVLAEQHPVNKIIGLRYFNVFGYGEAHKAHMASVVYKFYLSYLENGKIFLFEGSDRIFRDFIHIDDIVKLNLYCFDQPVPNGIYNAGTGTAHSFMDLALAFQHTFPDAVIEEIPFPEMLKNRYQYFTEATMEKLQKTGFKQNVQTITEGVAIYLQKLMNHE
jgi:ADP-L-glycero-D-manno-heptose 6-epimerase